MESPRVPYSNSLEGNGGAVVGARKHGWETIYEKWSRCTGNGPSMGISVSLDNIMTKFYICMSLAE